MKTLKNRNYQRIDNKILDAYKKELLNGTAKDVSITNLCKEAGINRTTFYKHYKETDEIFFRLQDDFVEKHFTFQESGSFKEFSSNPEKYLQTLASVTINDAKYIEKLLHPHYVYRIMKQIEDNIFKEIKLLYPDLVKKHGECIIRLDINYLIGGSFAIIVSFIRHEMSCLTIDNVITQISESIKIGIKQYHL